MERIQVLVVKKTQNNWEIVLFLSLRKILALFFGL